MTLTDISFLFPYLDLAGDPERDLDFAGDAERDRDLDFDFAGEADRDRGEAGEWDPERACFAGGDPDPDFPDPAGDRPLDLEPERDLDPDPDLTIIVTRIKQNLFVTQAMGHMDGGDRARLQL